MALQPWSQRHELHPRVGWLLTVGTVDWLIAGVVALNLGSAVHLYVWRRDGWGAATSASIGVAMGALWLSRHVDSWWPAVLLLAAGVFSWWTGYRRRRARGS